MNLEVARSMNQEKPSAHRLCIDVAATPAERRTCAKTEKPKISSTLSASQWDLSGSSLCEPGLSKKKLVRLHTSTGPEREPFPRAEVDISVVA